jgi:transposase
MDPFAPSDAEALITLGVDTHADVHVGVALDQLGRRLGSRSVPTTQAGYAELLAWAESLGALDSVGVEGSGSFGVGLVRFLRAKGVGVVEVNRPNRQSTAVGSENTTRPTPRLRPERCRPTWPPVSPRPPTASWR